MNIPPRATPSSGILCANATARFSGIDAEILLGGEAAPMTVMSMTIQQDQGAPAHISFEEDKVFCVNEGHLLFLIDMQKIEVNAGDRLFVAKGVTHGFSALGGVARITLVSTPARHDRFFQAMGALPAPHDLDQVQVICETFGQAIVGQVVTA
ncbi:cupin domain-containing protein [Sphingomonas lycopersici]|uniref:Cupin domain-containing protein n=1 Tax=Sphingomonas lycopersici TaxID=2951807 RepID=A0AA41Z6P4_9SPHN|nr:cupin domain-containing protein [Sphingomonas lycopersici]MCW6533847.1 cupin domain-containing protein [Sphingomonas lycopersici]